MGSAWQARQAVYGTRDHGHEAEQKHSRQKDGGIVRIAFGRRLEDGFQGQREPYTSHRRLMVRLTTVDANTMRITSPSSAPSATRLLNSLVRRAAV